MQFHEAALSAFVIFYHAAVAACAYSKLLTGGTIVAYDEGTRLPKVIRDGLLLIREDRIAWISDGALPDNVATGDVEVIDCTDKIITPGFIDTHRHGWQTVFKTLGSNTTLAEYFSRYSALVARPLFTPEDLYISQLAGIHEALNAGVTTILDHAHHTWTRELAAAGLNASVDSGARIFWAYTFQNVENFGIPDQISQWRELSSAVSSKLTALSIAYDDFANSPEGADTLAVVNLVHEGNAAVLTTHHVEGPWMIEENSPEGLHRVGILNSSTPIVVSHAASLTPRGAQLLRSTNQHISITPESEMHYGHLHPASHLILDQASLGVDTHFAFSTDILTQARMWLQTTRYRVYKNTLDRWEIPVGNPFSVNQAFLLATRNGGLALGRKDLGVIAPDAKADIVVWDGCSPSMLGWSDPIAAVILHASVGDIEHVLVDGEFVKRDGKLVIEGYKGVQDRFLRSAKRIQGLLKATPLPQQEGAFLGTGYPYGQVMEIDVQRGEGTGYGPIYA